MIAALRPSLTPNYFVYKEFQELCEFDPKITEMLSSFFWWADVIEKTPHRNGWFWKTAADLKREIGLSRRGYEKCRTFLLKLGVLEYKRAGVFAKMHWKLNIKKLTELVFHLKGMPVPDLTDKRQIDHDGFSMPNWIPLDLWNIFLDVRLKNGKKNSTRSKRQNIANLEKIRQLNQDIRTRMEASIAGEWATFYPDNNCAASSAVAPVSMEIIQKQIEAERCQNAQLAANRASSEQVKNHLHAIKAKLKIYL